MKKYLFDPPVLIAGVIQSHPLHESCYPWLVASQKKKFEGYLSAQAIVEIYSILTKIPIRPVLAPEFVKTFVLTEILDDFQIVDLSTKDYHLALTRAAKLNRRGASVYDCLQVQAALKKNCDAMVTLNSQEFLRLALDDNLEIFNPQEVSL